MIAWTLLSGVALGWTQTTSSACGNIVAPGAGATWYLVDIDNDWDATYEAAVIDAAEQWDGGVGRRNRGYAWNYTMAAMGIGPIHNDLLNEVGDASMAHMVSVHAQPTSVLALTSWIVDAATCNITEADIEPVDDDTLAAYAGLTWSWTDNPPSWGMESATTTYSLPAAMVHEFGHAIGFDHVNDPVSVMERRTAAELGGKFRIHENDYAGMVALKGDSSTGKNFVLGKWVSPSTTDRTQLEVWSSDGAPPSWQVTHGQTLAVGSVPGETSGPAPITLAVDGTGTYTVDVVWTLSNDFTCFDADDVTVGTRLVKVVANSPTSESPSGYNVPSTLAAGMYWMCAGVNPYGTLAETDASDNVIISERLIQVL
ncbi:MAG: matrixin family metalloprotease [Myxococcota bacterium]